MKSRPFDTGEKFSGYTLAGDLCSSADAQIKHFWFSISALLWYYLHHIANLAVQGKTDLFQNLCCNEAITAHLRNGCRAYSGFCTEILFLHILIDK